MQSTGTLLQKHAQAEVSSLKRKSVEDSSSSGGSDYLLDASNRNTKRRMCSIQGQVTSVSPTELAFRLFQENGFNMKETDALTQLPFIKPTTEMINGYQPEKIRLVRSKDLEGMRALHQKGESFDCCNRFGESLLHMACRRGCTEMVEFMVKEVKVSTLFIRDDYGRNILHDAFWTAEPNYDLAMFLITQIPEFLCVRDVRGHTPLDYVRKDDSKNWCNFLLKLKDALVPRYIMCDKKKLPEITKVE